MAEIVQLTAVNEKTCKEINALLPQLSDARTSLGLLQATAASPTAELWVVTEAGKIVGMATLVLMMRVAGMSSRIEDFVVDEAYRGKGLGKMLCGKLVERAKARGAYSIHLTSRPDRVAANALYKKLGFEQRNTNAYRLQLKR
ncbi:hypothetical protein A3A39_04700 [Candidatus Kaiserbacteria bacterium RIFCSPLOWO2_01_FULL_54_13]|uniref:N-acetyltransferase domain-containing protein n=1 Tax=Candidatus Kaiserbacteria bacterium RIFCSPLOWO2_01_FULL_54_13 TaxID=1798512 RepID=A0A1F6F1W2_9BACT|nr:MAG: hypothetical protein A3A39_04700 [Candidatus Kaiserbacteria bacterium RIFCSPLOWO2_01_FULL_54_13]